MSKPYTNEIYFAKQNVKMMIMLSNSNMQTEILKINRESIVTLLNKLPYLSDSRHLKVGMCI